MKKIAAALTFTMGLILCGCGNSAEAKLPDLQNGNTVDPSESAINEVTFEDSEGESIASELDSNATEIRAIQGGPYGEISISLPEGWSYEAYPIDSDDLMYGDYGIHFYPEGVNEGYIALSYYDWFGVCGTGLKEDEVTIAGKSAYMGTYDNHDYWDFVTFRGKYEGVVVALTYSVEDWWKDYGDQALDILETLVFDPNVKEGGAYIYSDESWVDEIELHFSLKNISCTGATLVFDQHDAKAIKGELIYGDDFAIEVLKDGKWEKAPIPIEGNYGFNAIAHIIKPGDKTEEEISWEWLYGELAPGEYRIGKSVSDHIESGNSNNYRIYAHFILSESSKELISISENWQSAEDILAKESNGLKGVHTGVDVRVFIAYNGGLYGCAADDEKRNKYYMPAGDFVFYNEQYKTEAYMVKDEPDLVAVIINGGILEYQKIFDGTFNMDGVAYGINYESGPVYSCGDIVLKTDDYTVYQAIRLQGERPKTEEYVVNVLPILQRTVPNFFNDEEKNYADAWWVALPMVEEFELSVVLSENKEAVKIVDNREIRDGGDDYALYYYGLDEVNITIDEQTLSLCDALVSGMITLNEIIAKANMDVKNGIIEECFFRDGGSQLYQYENYTIIKYNTADGSNRDMYIGTSDMDIHVANE